MCVCCVCIFVPDNVRESLSGRTGSGMKSSREENVGQKMCGGKKRKPFICPHGWNKISFKGKKKILCQLG